MEYEDFSCPFLRLKANPEASATYPTAEHVCIRSRPVSSPSIGYQQTFCIKAFHTTCPVFTGQRRLMPIGFRGPGLRTSPRRTIPAWLLWLILPVIAVLLLGFWWYWGFPAVLPGKEQVSFDLPFPPVSTISPAGSFPVTLTIASPTAFLRSMTPSMTLLGSASPTRTPTKTLTATPSRIPTITPTNKPGWKDQTITFGALPDKVYGDSDFPVNATASSGLPVTFSTSGNCTNVSNWIHLTGIGTCTVTALQGGGGGWNPAPPVAHTFNITTPTPSMTPIPTNPSTFTMTFPPTITPTPTPSMTPIPTNPSTFTMTFSPPTDTPTPPTDTPIPPTDTPIPPTDTPIPPTDTSTP